jgi:hypothetical protein
VLGGFRECRQTRRGSLFYAAKNGPQRLIQEWPGLTNLKVRLSVRESKAIWPKSMAGPPIPADNVRIARSTTSATGPLLSSLPREIGVLSKDAGLLPILPLASDALCGPLLRFGCWWIGGRL